MSLAIHSTLKKQKYPSQIPYAKINEKVLGKNYELSLVFCSDRLSRRLNHTLRKKDRPTDVLSFPLSATEGELFINLSQVRRQTKQFDRAFPNLVAYIYIHGLAHLKGYQHGDKMDSYEANIRQLFSL